MLKWVSNNSILEQGEGQASTPRSHSPCVENIRRTVGALSILGAKVEDGEGVPDVVLTSAEEEHLDNHSPMLEELPLTPLKDHVTRAMSTMSLEFPFAARFINSPSVDSGVGSRSSKSSLFANATRILESPFKTFDHTALLNYSPSTLSNFSSFSLNSRTPMSQMVDLLSTVITIPCITRFPTAVARYGGVAFILAYTIVLVLLGFPCMYLQHNLARLEQKGPVQLWFSLVPISGGLGTALATLSLFMAVQYSVITSHSIIYLINSFYTPLPWTLCSSWWNTPTNCEEQNHHHEVADFLAEVEQTLNITLADHAEPAYQQFWYRYLLSGGEGTFINVKLVLVLICLWVIMGATMLNGHRSVFSRVQVSLTIFVFSITIAFLIKLFISPDMLPKIFSVFTPTWSSLTTTTCWQEAVLLSSLAGNINTGAIQAVASRSNKRHDHSTLLLSSLCVHLLICCVWSVITLALVGDIKNIGLSPLVLVSESLAKMSGGQAWSQAWYSMTTSLGMMSMLSSLLGPLSFAHTKHKTVIRIGLGLGTTFTCLMIAIVCTLHTPTDQALLSLLSRWGIYFPSFLLSAITTATLTLAYGLSRATDRIAAQDGHKMHLFLLKYLQVTVSISTLFFIYFSFSYLPTTSLDSNTHNQCTWLESLGWVVTVVIVCQILIGCVVAVIIALKYNSYGVISWKQLLGSTTLRSSRIKLVNRSSRLSSSSYKNFEMCDIRSMSDMGTPSRLRPNNRTGLSRRLSLSPSRGEN